MNTFTLNTLCAFANNTFYLTDFSNAGLLINT